MFHPGRVSRVYDLWIDGLICAFEFVRGSNRCHWVPIGWARISELTKIAENYAKWSSQQIDLNEDEDDITVSGVVARPIWWCHVFAGHSSIYEWLSNAHWLHPTVSIYLRDENKHCSDYIDHFGFEVPVEMEGGLLFELLGYSVSDPSSKEDDTPIVLRSYHTQQFLLTVLHLKGSSSKINVKGINEVQDLLSTGRIAIPKSVHEVIAQLAYHLSRWDDRLFRKFIFGAANEIELRFLNWRTYEDPHLINVIFNQDIKKLATKVFRVQWSLHARKEIVFGLRHRLRGSAIKSLLEEIQNTTNEMLQEQEVVRRRLFTIQDVLKSTVRACLEDKTRRITHNGGIIGISGLFVSIIVSMFKMNLDGIPGAKNSPYAFASFCVFILFIGIVLTYFSML